MVDELVPLLDQLQKEVGPGPVDGPMTVEERATEKLKQIETLKGFVKDSKDSPFTMDDRGIVWPDPEEAERAREGGAKIIGRKFKGPPGELISLTRVEDPKVNLEPVDFDPSVAAPMGVRGIKPKIFNQNTIQDHNLTPVSDADLEWLNKDPEALKKLQEHQEGSSTSTFGTLLKGAMYGRDAEVMEQNTTLPERLIHTTIDAAKGIYGIASGQIDPHDPAAIKSAFEGASALTFLPAPVVSKMVDGSLGTMAGVRSKGFDVSRLETAMKLSREGANPDQIWKETQMFRAADGRWTHEIEDTGSKLLTKETNEGVRFPTETTLNKVYSNPKVFSAYPEIKNIKVREMTPNEVKTHQTRGLYNEETNTIAIAPGLHPKAVEEILLHEVQHGIQRLEGFARGGNPSQFLTPEYRTLAKEQNNLAGDIQQISNKSNHLPDFDTKELASLYEEYLFNNKHGRLAGWLNPNGRSSFTEGERDAIKEIERLGLQDKLLVYQRSQGRLGQLYGEATTQYRKLAGEVNARNATERLELARRSSGGPDRFYKEVSPLYTQEYANSEQIIQTSKGVILPPSAAPDASASSQDIKDLFQQGKTRTEIADTLGLKKNQVAGYLDSQGLSNIPKDNPLLKQEDWYWDPHKQRAMLSTWSPERLQHLKNSVEQGIPMVDIAKQLDISKELVRKKAETLGLKVTAGEDFNAAIKPKLSYQEEIKARLKALQLSKSEPTVDSLVKDIQMGTRPAE